VYLVDLPYEYTSEIVYFAATALPRISLNSHTLIFHQSTLFPSYFLTMNMIFSSFHFSKRSAWLSDYKVLYSYYNGFQWNWRLKCAQITCSVVGWK
jgi:hypothetical protein